MTRQMRPCIFMVGRTPSSARDPLVALSRLYGSLQKSDGVDPGRSNGSPAQFRRFVAE